MKGKWLISSISTSIFLFSGGMVWFFDPAQPRAAEIDAALHTTIVPRLSVHGAFYTKATDIVLHRLREGHPELREVPIISQLRSTQSSPPPGWGSTLPAVDLEFHDVPADYALQSVAMQTGMGYAVRDGAIYLYSITWLDDEGYVPPLTRSERCRAYLDYWYEHIREDYLHLPP